jgi:hypothetical protein
MAILSRASISYGIEEGAETTGVPARASNIRSNSDEDIVPSVEKFTG